MKDEVPTQIIDAHVRAVGDAINAGQPVDATYNLDRSGIAGTGADRDEFEKGALYSYVIESSK